MSDEITLYLRDIRITGHPPRHGVADLQLVIDTNDTVDTHVILTADLLLALHRAIGQKLAEFPIHLVTEEVAE